MTFLHCDSNKKLYLFCNNDTISLLLLPDELIGWYLLVVYRIVGNFRGGNIFVIFVVEKRTTKYLPTKCLVVDATARPGCMGV